MPITDLLERNNKLYGDEVALVEINPEIREEQRVTWKEYELIQPTSPSFYRRQITWAVFDEKANRVANMLLEQGISRGQKCAVLMMNCLEWLPIYFGILKAGAVAVPLNFRFTSDEIDYCLKLADVDVLFYGPEFIGRSTTSSSRAKTGRAFSLEKSQPAALSFVSAITLMISSRPLLYAASRSGVPGLNRSAFSHISFSRSLTIFRSASKRSALSFDMASKLFFSSCIISSTFFGKSAGFSSNIFITF